MFGPRWTITTDADDLQEGLFGQVVLWTLEALPHLERRRARVTWRVRSARYGAPPDGLALPGLFDAVQPEPAGRSREVRLLDVLARHKAALGGDFAAVHRLWTRHFAVPAATLAAADAVGLGPRCLGLHYRGTDKQSVTWDSNPVSGADFLALAAEFARRHPDLDTVFVATDEPGFLPEAGAAFAHLRVVSTRAGAHHLARTFDPAMGRGAVLDCVLLSRCRHVLLTSSALSAFACVLNPTLDAHRVAASKRFHEVPYFPVAYVPVFESGTPEGRAILARTMAGDWRGDPEALRRFGRPFAWRPQRPLGRRIADRLRASPTARAARGLLRRVAGRHGATRLR